MIVIVALFPLPGASLRFFYDTYLIEDKATAFGYMLKVSPTWASQTGNFVAMAYSFITCMITLYLELRTYWAYKRMNANMRAKHRKDFRLLIYAMLTFFGQFLWTVFSLSNFLVYLTKDTRFSSPLGGPVTHSTIVDIICLTGSVCLFSTR
ncbi:hypothetical protein AAVH_27051 [Aphelenchoides avenae]|nr:hypothetical protein AAVH_27051 [Aphelenchus avenae]